MIKVHLRTAMALHAEKTGQKLTYADIAQRTGLSKATLEALGSRSDYNTTLATIDALCTVLECELIDLLEYIPNERPKN